ncbi:uncharacterized protein [Montipora foliosa]|uniref:uncharacterized protein n=1 Tax=Montipora foliosa TaxID=591990 RepID=UPI0035F14954
MALFECCSKQLVKDTGRSTLRPVVDLNSASRCDILCVVVKKRSRWFWKSVKYETTPFTLDEILTKPVSDASQIENSVFIHNYKNEPRFNVNGKLGTKIAKDFGIDISAVDSFTVSMDVGAVIKREVKWKDLNELLKDQMLNLDHEFVQYILAKPRRCICIVYQTVVTESDTDVDSDSVRKGDASVTAGKPKLSINLSGSVQAEHHRSFELPKNTILGFACYEMTFDSALGTFELVLPDSIDGDELHVTKKCIFDEPDGQNDKALAAVFGDLFNSAHFSRILKVYRMILAYPQAIAPLRDVLEGALSCSEEKGLSKPLFLADFKTGVGEGYESCKELLILLGFELEEGKDTMTFSETASVGVLRCCTGLAEALVELSPQQCKAIKEVSVQYKEPLLYLLKNTMYGKATSSEDKLFERLWTHSSNPAKDFLLTLGFECSEKVVRSKWDFEHSSIEDVYVSVFVLCSA